MPIKNKGNYRLSEVAKLQVANDWPTAQVIYTSDILESAGNLYFTNTRVLLALDTANVRVDNLTVSGDLVVQGNTVTLNTAILTVEDKNISLANGAVNAAAADGAGFYIQGANANLTYLSATDRFIVNRSFETTGNLIANGLIIRNITVSDSVLTGSTSANNIVADTVTSNIWYRLYTANVIETAGNLYFTNTRAIAALTAGQNITIEANGRISALQNATVINDSTTVVAAANTVSYGMGRNISSAVNILVSVEGIVQIPTVDYNVAGTNLVLTDQPPVGANIEIRFFGTEAFTGQTTTLNATVNTFTGDGSNTTYNLTVVPPSKAFVTVNIDGVVQLSDAFNLTGRELTFTEAPGVNANIEVKSFTAAAGGIFNTRTYTGDGNTKSYIVSTGFSASTLLVFENGIAQIPGSDYSYTDGRIDFVTAPAANIQIQIRELGFDVGVGSVLNTLRGVDLVTGNITPTSNLAYDLGSAERRFKNIYANNIILGNVTLSATGGIVFSQVAVNQSNVVIGTTVVGTSSVTTTRVSTGNITVNTSNIVIGNVTLQDNNGSLLTHSDVSKLILSPFLFMK